jgi:hypothetical protein
MPIANKMGDTTTRKSNISPPGLASAGPGIGTDALMEAGVLRQFRTAVSFSKMEHLGLGAAATHDDAVPLHAGHAPVDVDVEVVERDACPFEQASGPTSGPRVPSGSVMWCP